MSHKKASFEASLAALEQLVRQLEGEIPLEEAVHTFQQGQQLIQQCETQLQAAEQVVHQLLHTGSEDELHEEPFF